MEGKHISDSERDQILKKTKNGASKEKKFWVLLLIRGFKFFVVSLASLLD